MKYQRFEELAVWKSAIQLGAGVYGLTERPELQKRYSLRDQIERAAVSVSNNIAKGFERGSNQELLTFRTSPAARRAKFDPCFVCWTKSLPFGASNPKAGI